MEKHKASSHLFSALALLVFLSLVLTCHGWGNDGHAAICTIAQSRLSDAALGAVKQLLPEYAEGELGKVCSWADQVKFRYHWSSPLHYINVPDSLCSFQYTRDCKDADGVEDRCVAGAINNYTHQLFAYKQNAAETDYNLTEALLFLSHLMGDIHQPLHVGHTSDKGGNTIDVHWYRRKTNLHHVWDDEIIETAEERFHDDNVDELVDALKHKIETDWASEEPAWEECRLNNITCPNKYASESIRAACKWAYEGVTEDSTLEDDYLLSRLPTVNLRLAQAAVRLAATLNRVFE